MQMGLFILESSKKIYLMVLARSHNPMAHFMLVSSHKECSKAKASSNGQTESSTKVNGKPMR